MISLAGTLYGIVDRTAMRIPPLQSGRRNLSISLLLVALLFRVYVPAGFMPASGAPFLLEMCPATYRTQMPAHHVHHHSGADIHFEDCPFGSTLAAGPIAHAIAFEPPAPIVSRSIDVFEPLRLGARLHRAHRARGPPSLT